MKSKVYFKKLNDSPSDKEIQNALMSIADKTPITDFIFKDSFTGIKMHMGEKGNEGYIKGPWIKPFIDKLSNLTKNLFITDANVIYRDGVRWNSLGHLKIADEHGFSISKLGLPVIIADGIMGRSYRNVTIKKKHFENVKIASDYFDVDSLISLAHLTSHMQTSLAASIKNIGMGCASRAGKLEQHQDALPEVSVSECTACGLCVKDCPENAITLVNKKASIDEKKCIGCGECTVICRFDAIKINWSEKVEKLQEKMVEYAYGAAKLFEGKICFFNFLINMTKDCDCLSKKAEKIIPDIGVLASRDPVAADKASLDLIDKCGHLSKFKSGYKTIDYSTQIKYAEEIGLGSTEYELIEIN